MIIKVLIFILFSCNLLLSTLLHAETKRLNINCKGSAVSCLEYGAKVYIERCTLCHGNAGLGDGVIPLLIENYPNVNLITPNKTKTRGSIRDMIIYGNTLNGNDPLSPPWSDELTLTQIHAITEFIIYFRTNYEDAFKLIRSIPLNRKPSYEIGRALYFGRCAICHGKLGRGDGKMAVLINSPPPADLTKSIKSDQYLREIIKKGGAKMKRSSKMPPWGLEFLDADLDSIIFYIKTFRLNE